MKKTLLIMRHSEAHETAQSGNDYERTLTPKGEEMARALATTMMEKNLWPDMVICSSAVRTRQTSDILRASWEGEMEPYFDYRTDLYRAMPGDVIKMLRAQDPGHSSIMIMGHNPTAHQLAVLLCMPDELKKKPQITGIFPPGSCAVLEFAMRSWAEVAEHKGILADFFYPKA